MTAAVRERSTLSSRLGKSLSSAWMHGTLCVICCATFVARLSQCIFEWSNDDLNLLKRAKAGKLVRANSGNTRRLIPRFLCLSTDLRSEPSEQQCLGGKSCTQTSEAQTSTLVLQKTEFSKKI